MRAAQGSARQDPLFAVCASAAPAPLPAPARLCAMVRGTALPCTRCSALPCAAGSASVGARGRQRRGGARCSRSAPALLPAPAPFLSCVALASATTPQFQLPVDQHSVLYLCGALQVTILSSEAGLNNEQQQVELQSAPLQVCHAPEQRWEHAMGLGNLNRYEMNAPHCCSEAKSITNSC